MPKNTYECDNSEITHEKQEAIKRKTAMLNEDYIATKLEEIESELESTKKDSE